MPDVAIPQDNTDVPASSDGIQKAQPAYTDMPAGDQPPKPSNQNGTTPAKNAYQSGDFTGYGPLEGTRWLKDQAQQQFAAMSMTSDNPGMYVRQKFDIDKKIDGFGQNLTLDDANHVWDNVFSPQFDGLKVKSVENEYDSRGKALLDQIYAPLGHGDTKPQWDQIPKNERIAAAAYEVVSALTGHGAQALSALARPLTLQEQDNVKKEQQKQQDEQLRRQGLVEQFNVLMGNKKSEVAAIEQRQREDAISRRGERKQEFEEKKQTDLNTDRAQQRWAKARDSGADSSQKKAALSDYEDEMQQITGNAKWKASDQDYAAASTKSTQEKSRDALIQGRVDRDKRLNDLAAPTLERAKNLARKAGLDADTVEYKLNNILPWVSGNLQEHIAKQTLDTEKLQHAKLNGWVTTAKGSTILKDASGFAILDAGGRAIKTVAEARAKVSDIDSLVHQQTQELGQDLLRAGVDQQGAAMIQGTIRDGLRTGLPTKAIEAQLSAIPQGSMFGGGIDKSLLSRAIAIEKTRHDNQALREKLGEAQAEPAEAPAPAPAGKSARSGGRVPSEMSGNLPVQPKPSGIRMEPTAAKPEYARAKQYIESGKYTPAQIEQIKKNFEKHTGWGWDEPWGK